MKNRYAELRERQQKEFDKFPIKFAFTDEQFKKSMEELGLKETDTDKIVSIGSVGGFIRLSDKEKLLELVKRLDTELEEEISKDLTGEGFIKDMFKYELANHEYIISRELDDTLSACGLSMEVIQENPPLFKGLQLAKKEYLEECYKEYEESEMEM